MHRPVLATNQKCKAASRIIVTLHEKMLGLLNTKSLYTHQHLFSSNPPSSGVKSYNRKSTTNSSKSGGSGHEFPNITKNKQKEKKQTRRHKPNRNHLHQKRGNNNTASSIVQPSPYSYTMNSGRNNILSSPRLPVLSTWKEKNNSTSTIIMPSVNASAILDPLNYCKGAPHLSNVSKGISGTDAAKRLLRGKRDFYMAARELNNEPVFLKGHGVPPALFQHCIDMADAFLRHYGLDTVECSFNNYSNKKSSGGNGKVPLQVRVRRLDYTNSCLSTPSNNGNASNDDLNNIQSGKRKIDWDYNLCLYITVMERLAKNLGQALELSSADNIDRKEKINNVHSSLSRGLNSKYEGAVGNDDDDDDGGGDQSFLFSPSLRPRWNVDILKGAYFNFRPISGCSSTPNHLGKSGHIQKDYNKNKKAEEKDGTEINTRVSNNHTDDPPPSPIVEFIQQNSGSRHVGSIGHVLIRVQGCARPNKEFGEFVRLQRAPQPLTLVFDARFPLPLRTRTKI